MMNLQMLCMKLYKNRRWRMNSLMHNEETYYTVVFWNNGDDHKNSRKFNDIKYAIHGYNCTQESFDNVEVRQYEVNYTVLFGKDGE